MKPISSDCDGMNMSGYIDAYTWQNGSITIFVFAGLHIVGSLKAWTYRNEFIFHRQSSLQLLTDKSW